MVFRKDVLGRWPEVFVSTVFNSKGNVKTLLCATDLSYFDANLEGAANGNILQPGQMGPTVPISQMESVC